MSLPKSTFVKITLLLLAVWFVSDVEKHHAAAARPVNAAEGLTATYEQDLAAFKRLRSGLFELADEVSQRSDLFGPRAETDPTLLRQDMRKAIHTLWYPIIDSYLALDVLAEKHMNFYLLDNKAAMKRSFFLYRAVFLTQYRVALELIAIMEQNPMIDTILNESTASLGLPQGVYSHFKYQYLNVAKAGGYAALETLAKAYKRPKDAELARWAVEDSRLILDAGLSPGPLLTLKNGLAILRQAGHAAWFPVQRQMAQWMGKTKVYRHDAYLIQADQIAHLDPRLEPGDILLERREWYLTNIGIPGFWTHAALFIGSAEQREALSQAPDVQQWLARQGVGTIDELIENRYPQAFAGMLKPYSDGYPVRVIEAISAGVVMTSLEYSATCDSLAVLRPQLTQADRAAAVVRAMRFYGRPYDFDFDFVSDAQLVCTELIFKSYLAGKGAAGLTLPMEQVMGRIVTPANALAQQFDAVFGTDQQQMELVLFLDGMEKENRAVEADVRAFRQSWNRPKWHILLPSDPAEN